VDLFMKSMQPLEKRFTMVYLDTRGSGRSERPAEDTQYRYEDFTADYDALRRHLKQERVWIVGISGGGLLALHYAIAYPQCCHGLILVDSIATHDDDLLNDVKARVEAHKNQPWYADAAREYQRPFSDLKDQADFDASMEACFPLYFSDQSNIEKTKRYFEGSTFSIAAARGVEASRDITNPEKLLPLEKIQVPTIIVVGSDDLFCSPLQAERLHLGIAGSKLIVIEKAGHFSWLEQPARFFDAIPKALASLGAKL
jgi:proline iminopeptidase